MEIVAIVSGLILIEYWVISFLVGVAREKTGVKAPAMQGSPEFERTSRVQQNTLEQLIVLLPAMWLFAFYVDEMLAAGLGTLFIIATRIDAAKVSSRSPSATGTVSRSTITSPFSASTTRPAPLKRLPCTPSMG